MVSPADDVQPLQFDTVVPRGATEGAESEQRGLTCVSCQQTIADEYFDINGQSFCATCRDAIAPYGEPSRGAIPFARAGVFGLGAAIAGAILYYAVIAITNLEIGLVAIAIGYMVGYAIRKGTGGLGGRKFQVLALILTYWSVGIAYVPLAFQGAAEARQQQVQPQAGEPAAPRAEADSGSTEVTVTQVIIFLCAFSFALPVLVIFGSLPSGLITAAIIAFGMHQAWRMTGVPQLAVTGPYRVGRPGAAVT